MRVVIMYDDRVPITLRLNCTAKEVPFELKARSITGYSTIRCYTGAPNSNCKHRKNHARIKGGNKYTMSAN